MTASPDDGSAAFFEAGRAGRLVIPRCERCGHWCAPYTFRGVTPSRCPMCASTELTWTTASGAGVLVTWTVVPARGSGPAADIVSGVVELAEGPWLPCLLDVEDELRAAGVPVAIEFINDGDENPVPVARPRGARHLSVALR